MIGTTSPNEKLHVVGNMRIEAATPLYRMTDQTGAADSRNFQIQDNHGAIYFGPTYDNWGWKNPAGLNTGVFTIDNNGHVFMYGPVGIYGADPANGANKLYVGGNVKINGALDVSGNVTAGGFPQLSDQRLKQNIVPLTGALAKLDQIRGVSFQWNQLAVSMGRKDGEKNIGMIAQELQKVYPELVVSTKNTDGQEYLSVDYGKFTAVLLQAVKELKAEGDAKTDALKELKDEIKMLKERIEVLEKK